MNKTTIINQIHKIAAIFNTKTTAFYVFIFISFCVISFQNDNYGFEKGHHGFLSSHGVSIAKNLSSEHLLLMFSSKWTDDLKGTVKYQAYNRFPVTSFILLKLAMSLFEDDLSMQVSICRQVMNLFFLGCLVFCFLLVFELSKNYLAAFSIVFLSASSAYLNFYNDMIFNDIPTLFGFILAAHGFIRYELYNKKLQMYIKSLIGISFGWQVFSIIIAFIVFHTIKSFLKNKSIKLVVKNNVISLGLVSLLFGISLLSYNLAVESLITDKPLSELSTIASAGDRLGKSAEFNKHYAEHLAWSPFIKDQMHRIGGMTIPYCFKKGSNLHFYGIFVLLFVLLSLFFSKHKVLLLTLIFSGFFWSFPMKNFTFSHDFQSIYYIGIPLSFYFILMHAIKSRLSILLPAVAVASIMLFLHTNIIFNISKAKSSSQTNMVINDLQNIRDIIGIGNICYVDGDIHTIVTGHHTLEFCLSGNFFSNNKNSEYIISRNRFYNTSSLLPNNSEIFLFRGVPYFENAFLQRGLSYLRKGYYSAAIGDFNKALEKKPDFVTALVNRGIAYKKGHRYGEAYKDLSEALQLAPKNENVLNSLSWFHATCPKSKYRNGEKAIYLSKAALKINHNPLYMDTLAAAYAEIGDFEKAISTQKEAIRFLKGKTTPFIINKLERRLNRYRTNLPWRE